MKYSATRLNISSMGGLVVHQIHTNSGVVAGKILHDEAGEVEMYQQLFSPLSGGPRLTRANSYYKALAYQRIFDLVHRGSGGPEF